MLNIQNIIYLFTSMCDANPQGGGDSTLQVGVDIAFKLIEYMEHLVHEATEAIPVQDELVMEHGSDMSEFDDNNITTDNLYDPISDTTHDTTFNFVGKDVQDPGEIRQVPRKEYVVREFPPPMQNCQTSLRN